jgi:hypothetical protein
VPHQEGQTWYLIRHGQVLAAVDEPRESLAAVQCLDLVEQTYDCAPPTGARDDVEMTLLVAGWFRSRPEELRSTMSPNAAREWLRMI